VTARLIADGPAGRAEAGTVLRAGGIVALPTDTVYGIAVDLSVPGGVERLFAAKQRSPARGIVLLLADATQAGTIGIMDRAGRALADAFWPGGLTLIVHQLEGLVLPGVLTGGAPTIGLRVPDHPAPRALAAAVGPLPATSANRSGQPDPQSAADVVASLGDAVDLILDGGPSADGRPSTVVDLTGAAPRVVRAGAVPTVRIREVLAAAGATLAE
jgi:L-threonylcarbamoyladenylate synthase